MKLRTSGWLIPKALADLSVSGGHGIGRRGAWPSNQSPCSSYCKHSSPHFGSSIVCISRFDELKVLGLAERKLITPGPCRCDSADGGGRGR